MNPKHGTLPEGEGFTSKPEGKASISSASVAPRAATSVFHNGDKGRASVAPRAATSDFHKGDKW
jgi:hypothetical protein